MFRRPLVFSHDSRINPKPARSARLRKHRRGLFLEALEDRHLLSVTFNEQEPNDSLATGQVVQSPGLTSVVDMITPSSGAPAQVATATNADFYRFVASVPGDLKVDVLNLGGNPDADGTGDTALKVSIFNNVDVQIGSSQTINIGATASFTVPGVNTTDVYKAKVEGDVAGNDAQYQIRIWNPDVNDDSTGSPANNNSRATATNLGSFLDTPITPANLTITRPDRDYFVFVAQQGEAIEVRATMPAGTGVSTGPNSPSNLGVRVRDSNGAILATSNATQTNVDSVVFQSVASATYYVEVYSGSVGQVNKYDLLIDDNVPTPTGTVSGFKFSDLNGDAFQDVNEPGLANWAIYSDSNNDSILNNPTSGNGICDAFATELCALTLVGTGSYTLILPVGTHTIREVLQSGWLQTYPTSEDNGRHVLNVTAGSNLDHIDFGNQQLGSIQVSKNAIPDDPADFNFTGTLGTFDLDDDGTNGNPLSNSQAFTNLIPGTYTVTESALGGWDLTSLVIVDPDNGSSVNLGTRTATIDLDPGETISATFTNTKRGAITISKNADPDDPADFNFTGTLGTFDLDDDGANGNPLSSSQAFTNLIPGTYTVTESALGGWDLTSLVIVDPDNGSSVNLGTRTATIDLDPGETITATFTNTKRGAITISKNAIPDDPADFNFTGTLGTFDLDDDGTNGNPLSNSQAFTNLIPGTYTVTESALAGWDLTSLVIVDPDNGSSVNLGTRTATIDLDPGETITATFTNTKRGAITISKNANPDDPADFNFTGSFGSFDLDDDGTNGNPLSNSQAFTNLVPGNYTVTESALAGWDLTSLVIVDPDNGSSVNLGTRTATIDLDPGEIITATFTNTKRGAITISKNADPDDPADFNFTGSLGTFDLDDDGTNGNPLSNSQAFTNLVTGTYTVTESALAGWDLTNLVIVDPDNGSSVNLGTRTATIDLDPGETITATFTNTKRGSITVSKNSDPDDPADFNFTGSFGSFDLDDDGANGNPLSNSQAFTNLVPGNYTVTESALAGWDLTSLVIVDPDNGSSVNLGTRTATIDLDPGESISVAFTNTKRGTITINKDAVPDDAQDFNYTGGLGTFDLDDDADNTLLNSQAFTNLVPGTYVVTEGSVPGWALTNLVIVDPDNGSSVNLGTRTATIDLDPGESISVTFTNTKGSSIQVFKDAIPNDAQDFGYTGSFGAFTLDDDADNTFSNNQLFNGLAPGSYTITEGAVAGWDLTSLVVVDPDNGSSVNLGAGTATIDLDAGENISVTFTNTKRGTVTIFKDASPNDTDDFPFTDNFPGSPGSFVLDDDGANGNPLNNSQVFGNLLPGTYTVTEGVVAGWSLTSLVINDPDNGSSINLGTRTATIDVDPGENITVTFVNSESPAFTGQKFHDQNGDQSKLGDPGLPGWTIELYLDGDNDAVFEPNVPAILGGDGGPIATTVTDVAGNYALGGQSLATARYFIREVMKTGWMRTTPATIHTINYTSGTTVANLDFGNNTCTDRIMVTNGTLPVTSERDGVLTLELFNASPFTVTSATPFQVYDPNTGSLTPAGLSFNSRVSEFDATHQRIDIRTTGAGTLFNVNFTGLSGPTVLRKTNSVNVAVATSLALQITGNDCGELIVVRDDKLPDGGDLDNLPDEVGGPSDAKWIFIGGFTGTINGGASLAAEGIRYNTSIINGVFGTPSISRIEVNSLGGDDFIRVGSELIVQQSTVNGGTGDDTIRVGDQKGTVAGGDGNDFMWGGLADDILNGDNGQDLIFGGEGADRANGLAGNDLIAGGLHDDPLLRGGDGDDAISGGSGADRLLGENHVDRGYRDGSDVFYSGFEFTTNIPPGFDDVEATLNALFAKVWNDGNLGDGNDTLEELINSLYP